MPGKKQQPEVPADKPPPDSNSPDYFRALTQSCIAAYEKFTNDRFALDYCRVYDKKLRAMILSDDHYQIETRNIYARKRLEEIEELNHLVSLAAVGDEDDGGDDLEDADPRNGRRPQKKSAAVDKDRLAMRFKAAQMRRELMADMEAASHDSERNAAFVTVVTVDRGEFTRLTQAEVVPGSSDDGLDELTGKKEEMPEGSSGKYSQSKAKTDVDAPYEKVLEDGEIVEL
jgi:hypothetical protein